MALLWPERDDERARHLLNQAVHAIRQALGAGAIRSVGGELQLGPAAVDCDLIAFEEALGRGAMAEAVERYRGPLLDGFHLDRASDFERWVDRERDRLGAAYARALEALAGAAERTGDLGAAVQWWKRRAAHDPYDSGAALRLALALEGAGNPAGALQQALAHGALLRKDLELEPPEDLNVLIDRLRRDAPGHAPTRDAGTVPASAPPPPVAPPDVASGDRSAPARAPHRPGRRLWWAAAAVLLAGLGTVGAVHLATGRSEPEASVSPQVADEIMRAVALELDRRARGDTAGRMARHRTSSIPAYELYLRGSDPALLRSDSAARLGLDYFRRAVALDSSYAAAWAGLARMTLRVGDTDPSLAEAAAARAVALDDSLGEAHASLGIIRMDRMDLVRAESHLRRAVALEPGVARYHEWLGRLHLWTGRYDDALAAARRAVDLAPLSPSATAEVARALVAHVRCDEALSLLEGIAQVDPPLLRAVVIEAQCHIQQERWSDALALLGPRADRGEPIALGMLGYAQARMGRAQDAEATVATLTDLHRSQGGAALPIALVHLGLRNHDRAAAWLERAADDRSLVPMSEPQPLVTMLLDSLRADPRLARVRRHMGR